MPTLYLPYLNIALDLFGLIVILIILLSSINERLGKGKSQRYFFVMLPFVMLALVADTAAWICEGYTELDDMIVVSNTVAYCMGYFAIASFMRYLKDNLCKGRPVANAITTIFSILAVISSALVIFSAANKYGYFVDKHGHYVHANDFLTAFVYISFPALAFLAIILLSTFAENATPLKKLGFVGYTIFPVIGVVLDYAVHGLSLTYVGLVVSVLVIYTNIHIKNQRIMQSQRNELMVSQINPHFVYNTLSAIAAMCELSPKQAKNLTINFASYLRSNINSLTSDKNIPFDEEIKHVECYLDIEKARFGDRVKVSYSIGCRDFSLPPLTLQPIVENAVKHGITKKAEGGTVKIVTYATDKHNVVEIRDDGLGFDAELNHADSHQSIGIENVKNRLYERCRGTLTIKSTVGVGTRVILEIPKKRRKR